ncbi:hypothetical protein EYF80_012840 [Liparis tanakae]|uniref:Uncharacterized protein n=1 Tax=Liparis tanakae TaxID=230148 RepID=A0A4Z2IHR6_9TELE|nr:hypothetical protein EYF80_012840 [Liparis tanakae]
MLQLHKTHPTFPVSLASHLLLQVKGVGPDGRHSPDGSGLALCWEQEQASELRASPGHGHNNSAGLARLEHRRNLKERGAALVTLARQVLCNDTVIGANGPVSKGDYVLPRCGVILMTEVAGGHNNATDHPSHPAAPKGWKRPIHYGRFIQEAEEIFFIRAVRSCTSPGRTCFREKP